MRVWMITNGVQCMGFRWLKPLATTTRMHSSRMRTGRSLTVCRSLLPGGGGGMHASWGVCMLWGGLHVSGRVHASWGGACFLGGCMLPGGCVLPGGCMLPRGVVSQHALRQTPPVNRMTDRCKNTTLATTSLRPVINCVLMVKTEAN